MDKIRFFIDFDGTVTTRDVVDALLERFARKEWLDVEKDWQAGRIGSRECLARQIDFVVAEEEGLLRLIDQVQVDPFFIGFLKKSREHGIPVSIVSDGFDLLIEPILKKSFEDSPELLAALPVFCNRLYWTGKGLKAVFTGPPCAHGCANCKAAVIKKLALAGEKIIFVGDGLSDRFAAEAADLTFAKGKLLEHCQTKKIAHRAYSGFREVTEWLTCHCEEPLDGTRGKLRDEAISTVKIASLRSQ